MSEEKNALNVYNQLEIIRNALSQIETIHVYELATRQYGNPSEEELINRVAELDAYVVKLNKDYQDALDNYQSAAVEVERLNKIINDVKQAHDNKDADFKATIESYKKLPRFIKKFYGVN